MGVRMRVGTRSKRERVRQSGGGRVRAIECVVI